MTKEILEKIMQNNTPLEVNDISVEEKKTLAEFLSVRALLHRHSIFGFSRKDSMPGKSRASITAKSSS